ncbi:hypothetical protein [Nocardioides sp.]|uniref:hypothetical protein n=1 Tax=Nocardioides sp. TaxID=35761 RepID=UPI0026063532|nr:hypothetical protein [Nocardioides sp.]MCW2738797.1 hypothetical protein [Nocardioides sp.]
MHPRASAVVTTAVLVLLVAGCADGGGSTTAEDPEGDTPRSSSPTTSSPPPTPPPTTPPSDGLQKLRVVGEVVQVGDCVVVEDDNATTWTIVGEPATGLVLGDRVQVTGAPDLTALGCGGPVVRASRVTVVT